jgi:hypothetical protein
MHNPIAAINKKKTAQHLEFAEQVVFLNEQVKEGRAGKLACSGDGFSETPVVAPVEGVCESLSVRKHCVRVTCSHRVQMLACSEHTRRQLPAADDVRHVVAAHSVAQLPVRVVVAAHYSRGFDHKFCVRVVDSALEGPVVPLVEGRAGDGAVNKCACVR